LVIWPVKIVPEMTYSVLSGMLNPTHSLTVNTTVPFKWHESTTNTRR